MGVQRPLSGYVVQTKRMCVEFDFINHLEAHESGGFQAYPVASFMLR